MTTKTTEQELLDLENQYWQAIKDKDVETALRLTDDPCIISGPQGVVRISRQALPRMLTAGRYTLREFRVGDDAQIRLVDDNVAIVAYKVHEELTVDGHNVTLDATDASTWIRRNGRWVCALHTESITGDPFGRDRHPAG